FYTATASRIAGRVRKARRVVSGRWRSSSCVTNRKTRGLRGGGIESCSFGPPVVRTAAFPPCNGTFLLPQPLHSGWVRYRIATSTGISCLSGFSIFAFASDQEDLHEKPRTLCVCLIDVAAGNHSNQ